jgi:ribosomal protein S12 methylthiotransferase accessory factor
VSADPRLHGDLDASDRALARALGVTRIARITGLDRTGVEVVSAVRPAGHVLQVTNGKGLRFRDAARGALSEAAELWAAERPAPAVLALASAEEAAASAGPGTTIVSPTELGGPDGVRCAWVAATALLGAGPALVPLDAVHCSPGGGTLHPAWCRWTSNGMGAAAARPAALLHALLEAIERDQLARALPEGFTEREVARRLVDPTTLAAAAPRTAALAGELQRRGFRVHLLDLSPSPSIERAAARARARDSDQDAIPPLDLGLPVAAAVIADEEGGPVPAAAGYACRLSRDAALSAALLEAAQSRATEIHGAREDVAWGARGAAAPLAALLAAVRPRRPASALPGLPARGPAAVREVLRRLVRAGIGRGATVDLVAPEPVRGHGTGRSVHVVKVVLPGLLLSELLC